MVVPESNNGESQCGSGASGSRDDGYETLLRVKKFGQLGTDKRVSVTASCFRGDEWRRIEQRAVARTVVKTTYSLPIIPAASKYSPKLDGARDAFKKARQAQLDEE